MSGLCVGDRVSLEVVVIGLAYWSKYLMSSFFFEAVSTILT